MDGLWTWELRVVLRCLHVGCVGHGGTIAQAGMQPERIILVFNVVEAGHRGLGYRSHLPSLHPHPSGLPDYDLLPK